MLKVTYPAGPHTRILPPARCDPMKLTYDKETGSVVDAGKAAPSGAPQEAAGDDLLSRIEAKHESDLTKEEKCLLQRERLKKLHGKDRLAYLWAYYKYVPVLIAVALFAVYLGVTVWQGIHHDPYVSLVVVGLNPLSEEAEPALDAAVAQWNDALDPEHAHDGIDTDTSIVSLSSPMDVQKFQILLSADADIDAVICGREVYDAYKEFGVFEGWLDLPDSALFSNAWFLDGDAGICVKTASARPEHVRSLCRLLLGE